MTQLSPLWRRNSNSRWTNQLININ